MAGGVALAGEADVVHGLLDLVGDVGEGLWRGLAADVGRGADDGLLEAVAELVGEHLGGDAQPHTAVLCQEVGGEAGDAVEDDGRGAGGEVEDVPGHIGHVADVALQASRAVHETDEGLAVLASFDLKDLLYRLGVGGVATDAPDGVGGIENGASLLQHLDGSTEVLVAKFGRPADSPSALPAGEGAIAVWLMVLVFIFHRKSQNSLVKWNLMCSKSCCAMERT